MVCILSHIYLYTYIDHMSHISIWTWEASIIMGKYLHTLAKKIYIMAVFSSNDFYSSHVSVIEWVEHKLLCHKNICEVWFKFDTYSNRKINFGDRWSSVNQMFFVAWPLNFSWLITAGDFSESMLIGLVWYSLQTQPQTL